MSDNRVKLPIKENDKDLDPQRFAYISDRTYTPAEVEELTSVVHRETPAHVRTAPNAKMFLRSFWYRGVMTGIVSSEEMHLYTVARCAQPPPLTLMSKVPTISFTARHFSRFNQGLAANVSNSAIQAWGGSGDGVGRGLNEAARTASSPHCSSC